MRIEKSFLPVGGCWKAWCDHVWREEQGEWSWFCRSDIYVRHICDPTGLWHAGRMYASIDHTLSCMATAENYYVFTHINCNGRMSKKTSIIILALKYRFQSMRHCPYATCSCPQTVPTMWLALAPWLCPQYFGTPNYNFKATWDMQNIGNFGTFSEQLKLKSNGTTNDISINFFFNPYCEFFPAVGIKEAYNNMDYL